MSTAASGGGAPSGVRGPAICGCAVWARVTGSNAAGRQRGPRAPAACPPGRCVRPWRAGPPAAPSSAEVDALSRRGRREPASGGDVTQRIRTRITLIDKDRYYFRGVDATELARRYGYEEIADWLSTGTLRAGVRFTAPAEPLAAARRAVEALPAHSGSADRLRVAAIAAAVADPLRFDLDRDAVLGSARTLIPTLVDALPTVGRRHRGEGRIAWRLWSRLTAERPDESFIRALDMALSC